jgi:pimeloyl-ACP methyl ester carboxylesterase
MHDRDMHDAQQTSARSDEPRDPASTSHPHAILVPGYWLGAWAWDAVVPRLEAAGVHTHAVDLPGLGDGPDLAVTLDDHIAAVVDLIDRLSDRVVLVGHSGGGLVVQGAVDRRPDRVTRVVYVDSGPLDDGLSLRPDATEDIELPSWDALVAEGSSIDGIDDTMLATFRERARPQPAGVASAPIRVFDDRRLAVPVTVVCTSLTSAQLKQMIDAGRMPSELRSVGDVRYVDLPTGHWPMFSRPGDLAQVLVDEILG